MKKFLSRKLEHENFHDFQIICFINQKPDPGVHGGSSGGMMGGDDQPQLLPEDLTLQDIENRVTNGVSGSDQDGELILYYTLSHASQQVAAPGSTPTGSHFWKPGAQPF